MVAWMDADFLSIDCGLEANYSGYKDPTTGIVYVSDEPYANSGENHRIAADQESKWSGATNLRTLRSFPSGVRNCYALPTHAGTRYLVRLSFLHGSYDGNAGWSTLRFDLYLGANRWATVDKDYAHEAVFVARASWSPVCLVNTGSGTPFVSLVELRPLDAALYPSVMANQSMARYIRCSFADNKKFITRYPDDQYDRYWWQLGYTSPTWKNLSTVSAIKQDPTYTVPLTIIQTAIEAVGNNTTLNITWQDTTPGGRGLKFFMYFADFQNSQLRQFNVSFNDVEPYQYSPPYLSTSVLYNTGWSTAGDGVYNISLVPTAASKLPPMINALEIYTLISLDSPTTSQEDFETIMAIKLEYGIKKNWMGDPCYPANFAWEGVKCSNPHNNISRIICLDLSNSNLHGTISNNFTLLTALQYLNLSCNQLTGPVPASLHKNNTGSFVFSFDSDGNMCNKPTLVLPPSGKKSNGATTLAVSVAVPVAVIVVLVLALLIWRHKRKSSFSTVEPSRHQPKHDDTLQTGQDHGDVLQIVENRQFTYKELEKITNKFERPIGKGGFGPVYYGHLEDKTEVAVKMRSESSSHGLDEFFAEVRNLTMVHHRNLVSLVGYCWENDHLALVYEYMAKGSICDRLRGNNNAVSETLNWRTRVRIMVEAAQGLDYLHKGCNLPIIHRDVKTNNILLGQNLQAKIADFGLSKTYLSETQTHITITPAGTAGYIDPEYYQTGRLTESSDVYSFGIVMLEIATGESPIIQGEGHIVQRVKRKIVAGNIHLIADARLGGAYDVSSMWKVVDTALLCTADVVAQRPTMSIVVAQLRECLALEEARGDSGLMGSSSTASDNLFPTSTFAPVAR
ncbi:probable LRR receptor-like serine/threonine-protein kinase At1g51820 [Oryza brachyantha]|uniref:probable LRR receptor-like serine/threonine-protein kinase At1g51820 n=1 Tax=Oryza brachyantha TaxID=4533 RepID=UPI00077687E9|nr:probable LRR receptor-like serine/threonine-protein kinase At1g51820 [Oryza brachyantha]